MGRNTSIIGITGKISTGKDTVSKIIRSEYNFQEINVDKIGHIALKLKQDKIVKIFGTEILNNQNEIERARLRNIVFKDKEKLEKLEAITHPIIYKEVEQAILKRTPNKIIINAALLFKLNLAKFCGYIFIIKANDEIIKKRIKLNRNIDENLIINMLKWQEDIFLKKNILNSKIINIINNKNYECLKKEIRIKMKGVI
ncbi:dephospho-CoA kinase [Borrelia miyamotoi]|uniref:Dephospho-CoA kinase n=1 Tax=Borrelia miyamotoi TaxID=47466 RepID=A0AAQ2WY01_9SPIR|nr:dephospho-CoA kinase [Borrelia miyamotoi]AGT27503.1 dephospho-CoA kinase [Borrelia miyamotoi LB-2001]AJA58684.1 dephospho-CoA kinase [Borrelia miyamotoi]AOW95765.1 dephospho-CoA kinase [Borrelia miyamotoi]QTL83651.1 dephospho-CoA kinase [Borrelia miyamotoi]WAZ85047.1 dephospho-CoA kinase [Borrelia miyamotoi]